MENSVVINKLLNRVGMKVFIKYFESFNNPKLTNNDIVELFEEDFTTKSKISRTSKARKLIRENALVDILEVIINAKKIDVETIEKAKFLLKKFQN